MVEKKEPGGGAQGPVGSCFIIQRLTLFQNGGLGEKKNTAGLGSREKRSSKLLQTVRGGGWCGHQMCVRIPRRRACGVVYSGGVEEPVKTKSIGKNQRLGKKLLMMGKGSI